MFWNSPASAQEKQCSAENLTAECRAFDSLPPVIVLPDGTSFKNPRKSQQIVNPPANTSMSNQKMLEMQDDLLEVQVDFVRTLDKVSLSEKFKSALANLLYLNLNLDETGELSLEKIPGATESNQQLYFVTVPWPPDDNKSKLQLRSPQEVLEYLNKTLPLDAKKNLKKMADTRKKYYMGFSKPPVQTDVNISTVTEARKKRIADLVQFAKDSIVRTLTGGRDLKLLTPEMQALVLKVQSVEYNSRVDSASRKTHCNGGPNAFYNPANNKFEICDSMMNFPDSQLITVIGHEIGHAIDPCNCISGVQKINSQLLSSYLNMPSPIMTSDEREILTYIGEAKETALNWDYYFSSELFNEFKRVELFTPKTPPVSYEKYPLLGARDCIVTGSKLRSVSKDKIPKMVDELALDRKKGEGLKTTDAEKKDYIQRFQKFPDCISDFGKSSEVAESMSDMIGANVFADYLRQNPIKTVEEKIGSLSFFLQEVCDLNQLNNNYKSSIKRTPSVADLQKEIKTKAFRQVDPHARNLVRINELFLAHPEVAAAFNCKPHSNSECYKKFPTKLPGLEPLKIDASVVKIKDPKPIDGDYSNSPVNSAPPTMNSEPSGSTR